MIGIKTKVWRQSLSNIQEEVEVGDETILHSHVWIGGKVKIGKNCKVQAFCFIPDGVILGNNVFLGPAVVFTNDKYPPSHGKGWSETKVEDGVSIGANATILPGLTIGKGAKIGAGSVVTKNIPTGETWAGNPAKKLK